MVGSDGEGTADGGREFEVCSVDLPGFLVCSQCLRLVTRLGPAGIAGGSAEISGLGMTIGP